MKDINKKGIIYKTLGTRLETASQYKECKKMKWDCYAIRLSKESSTKILLSLQIEQLQKQIGEKRENKV